MLVNIFQTERNSDTFSIVFLEKKKRYKRSINNNKASMNARKYEVKAASSLEHIVSVDHEKLFSLKQEFFTYSFVDRDSNNEPVSLNCVHNFVC